MIKKIFQLILGIVLGIVFLYLFIYIGGADYLKAFGKNTEQAGEELKRYEKSVKDSAEKVLEKAKARIEEKMP